jgi:hypothetical protein
MLDESSYDYLVVWITWNATFLTYKPHYIKGYNFHIYFRVSKIHQQSLTFVGFSTSPQPLEGFGLSLRVAYSKWNVRIIEKAENFQNKIKI